MRIGIFIALIGLGFAPLWAQQAIDEPGPAGANAGADVTQAVEPADPPTTQPATQPAATQPAATQPAATQPATTQPAATQPATTQPATVNPQPAATPAPQPITSEALADRVRELIREPAPTARRAAVQRQLADLTDNASQLYYNAKQGPIRLTALSVQMQALYTQVVEDPESERVDRLLSRLRAAARRTKSLDQPDADAVGDFWLMTAELLDLNRMKLGIDDRREQAAELMAAYIADHPDAGPTKDVKTALADLNRARGIVDEPDPAEIIVPEPVVEPPVEPVDEPAVEPEPEPAPATQPAEAG